MSENYKQYRRTNVAEMRPYEPGEDLTGVSVSDTDAPETDHGMIARNPANHEDRWYVARAYFDNNFEEITPTQEAMPGSAFPKRDKAEPTRGPWKWIKQFPANGWALVTDDPEQDGIVAEAMGNGIWFPNDGGEADAHLIAAAPRMKAALEQAITSMLDSGYSPDSLVVRECRQALPTDED